MLTTRMGVKVEWVYPVPVQWKLRPQIRTDSETELSAFRQSFGCYVYAVFVHICDAWICHDKYMYYSAVFRKKFLAELKIYVRRNSKKNYVHSQKYADPSENIVATGASGQPEL